MDPELLARAAGPRRAVELTYSMLRAYALDEPDLTDAVRLMRSMLHGLINLEATGGFAHARPAEDSWVRCLDALHTLLEHWPAHREGDPK
ncbi:TetR-like C-terminal domain-containing protein [Sphaerisporangium sp. NPDC051017]|uniref:TetR-like C-terminal domain-containing protein n=1 Tax=Sphaerisporangium sp. NPDC051017 TaxID=3154636 RepID=UPI0034140699